jgi:hypothetical protein
LEPRYLPADPVPSTGGPRRERSEAEDIEEHDARARLATAKGSRSDPSDAAEALVAGAGTDLLGDARRRAIAQAMVRHAAEGAAHWHWSELRIA